MNREQARQSRKCYAYDDAFARNFGFLSRADQNELRFAHVAVAGLGGVGGAQALALARCGIGHFSLADPETFELVNFNRQLGATVDSVGRKKIEVIREMILAINPEAGIRTFPEGVTAANMDLFLDGADVAVDGLDFFAIEAKRMLFKKCSERGIWALTAAPLGFGSSLLIFKPGAKSFDAYFDLKDDLSLEEKTFRFAYGLAPNPLCTDRRISAFVLRCRDLGRERSRNFRSPRKYFCRPACKGLRGPKKGEPHDLPRGERKYLSSPGRRRPRLLRHDLL